MVHRVPEYFDRFHCLAGACPDTCCGQWAIVVDDAAKKRYLSVEGPLGEELSKALTEQDGETCMVLKDGRCPLLTKDGLCSIVLEKGEEFLSTTCHTHPRFTEVYGNLSETMLSLSCPEAARLLMEQETPLQFLTTVSDQPPEPTDLDPRLFSLVLESRNLAMALVQDRSRPLSDRLSLFLLFARKLDRRLRRPRAARRLLASFTDADLQDQLLRRLRRLRKDPSYPAFLQRLMEDMEHLSPDFPALLSSLGSVSLSGTEPEQLCVYYLFRWWLKAGCNGHLWRQAAACVVSVLTVSALTSPAGNWTEAARLYSKEIEHSEENLTLLRRRMDRTSLRRLLRSLEASHAI